MSRTDSNRPLAQRTADSSQKRIKAALFCNQPETARQVYGAGRYERLAGLVDLYPVVVTAASFDEHLGNLPACDCIFSTWGMPCLTPGQIAKLSNLKALFYAAGTVKNFAVPFLDKGITVVSAWAANGVPVAEFCLAQILLGCKGYFRNALDSRDPTIRHAGAAFKGPGIFNETIALIGCGMIARTLIGLLKPFRLSVIVVDPYLCGAEAAELGVRRVSLEEAFTTAFVVSNHLPNLPSTKRMLTAAHFESMRQGAVFINTGRGAQVAEEELIAVLEQRPDITALLDVTDPEPPAAGSKLYTLRNCHLTSHIAGSINNETVRMADLMIDEYEAWAGGKPLRYAVSKEMLERIA